MILLLSDTIIPLIFMIVIVHALSRGISLFDVFVKGVGDGLETVRLVFPTLLGLMVGVGILRSSGALDLVTHSLAGLTGGRGFPVELIPMTSMRVVSASAARGLYLDVMSTFGADSFSGRLSSIIMSSTETIFYTMSVYCLAVGVTKSRYTLAGALLANLAGVVVAFFVTLWVFGVA